MITKKTLGTLLLLASIIFLAACGGGSQTEASEAPVAEAPVATEAPAEESVKPEPPSQEMGPQLPEGSALPVSCSADGYTEMMNGETLTLDDPTGQHVVATITRIDATLEYKLLVTNGSFSDPIPFGDQSSVSVMVINLPVPQYDGTIQVANFVLLICGDHIYAPFERGDDGTLRG